LPAVSRTRDKLRWNSLFFGKMKMQAIAENA
jgi:hypothetical protein